MNNEIVLQVEGTERRICEDIAKRQQFGIQKYKTTVEKKQPNPKTVAATRPRRNIRPSGISQESN
jgi:hypothetical protein